MQIKKRILLIDDIGKVATAMQEAFANDKGIELVCSSSARNELRNKLGYDYFIIYINHEGLMADLRNLVAYVTAFLNYMNPVMLAFSSDYEIMSTSVIPGLGFLPLPLNVDVIHKQALNAIDILSANRSINDVSHLPGNFAIDATLRDKIEKGDRFVLVYIDIDKFKPYTDYYGLYMAGQLIGFLTEILSTAVAHYGSKNDFIGHIGGDDFVLILNDYSYAEDIGNEIIRRFDDGISQYYEPEDLERGYIEVLNRKGEKDRFGPISLSIAMVSNEFRHFDSTDEVYKRMMMAKDEAKQISGSVMLCDTSKL
jgi:GGDEF domain-containing protein